MISVVNEPMAVYRVADWLPSPKYYVNESIIGIENNIILFSLITGSTSSILIGKPKIKLSSLRGKMKKQSEDEIDKQILDLRKEWDRNI